MSDIKVELINVMGNDNTVLNSARVSNNKDLNSDIESGSIVYSKLETEFVDVVGSNEKIPVKMVNYVDTGLIKKDIKLINYLAKNKHMTPFEHCVATFMITCPLYIRSQIHRHRTFSYNEVSRRYTSDGIQFYFPKEFHEQASQNKQSSAGKHPRSEYWLDRVANYTLQGYALYQDMVNDNVSREEARAYLPQALQTRFYMTGNIRNFAHFIGLRKSPHAQYESRLVAEEIEKILKEKFPHAITYMIYWGSA